MPAPHNPRGASWRERFDVGKAVSTLEDTRGRAPMMVTPAGTALTPASPEQATLSAGASAGFLSGARGLTSPQRTVRVTTAPDGRIGPYPRYFSPEVRPGAVVCGSRNHGMHVTPHRSESVRGAPIADAWEAVVEQQRAQQLGCGRSPSGSRSRSAKHSPRHPSSVEAVATAVARARSASLSAHSVSPRREAETPRLIRGDVDGGAPSPVPRQSPTPALGTADSAVYGSPLHAQFSDRVDVPEEGPQEAAEGEQLATSPFYQFQRSRSLQLQHEAAVQAEHQQRRTPRTPRGSRSPSATVSQHPASRQLSVRPVVDHGPEEAPSVEASPRRSRQPSVPMEHLTNGHARRDDDADDARRAEEAEQEELEYDDGERALLDELRDSQRRERAASASASVARDYGGVEGSPEPRSSAPQTARSRHAPEGVPRHLMPTQATINAAAATAAMFPSSPAAVLMTDAAVAVAREQGELTGRSSSRAGTPRSGSVAAEALQRSVTSPTHTDVNATMMAGTRPPWRHTGAPMNATSRFLVRQAHHERFQLEQERLAQSAAARARPPPYHEERYRFRDGTYTVAAPLQGTQNTHPPCVLASRSDSRAPQHYRSLSPASGGFTLPLRSDSATTSWTRSNSAALHRTVSPRTGSPRLADAHSAPPAGTPLAAEGPPGHDDSARGPATVDRTAEPPAPSTPRSAGYSRSAEDQAPVSPRPASDEKAGEEGEAEIQASQDEAAEAPKEEDAAESDIEAKDDFSDVEGGGPAPEQEDAHEAKGEGKAEEREDRQTERTDDRPGNVSFEFPTEDIDDFRRIDSGGYVTAQDRSGGAQVAAGGPKPAVVIPHGHKGGPSKYAIECAERRRQEDEAKAARQLSVPEPRLQQRFEELYHQQTQAGYSRSVSAVVRVSSASRWTPSADAADRPANSTMRLVPPGVTHAFANRSYSQVGLQAPSFFRRTTSTRSASAGCSAPRAEAPGTMSGAAAGVGPAGGPGNDEAGTATFSPAGFPVHDSCAATERRFVPEGRGFTRAGGGAGAILYHDMTAPAQLRAAEKARLRAQTPRGRSTGGATSLAAAQSLERAPSTGRRSASSSTAGGASRRPRAASADASSRPYRMETFGRAGSRDGRASDGSVTDRTERAEVESEAPLATTAAQRALAQSLRSAIKARFGETQRKQSLGSGNRRIPAAAVGPSAASQRLAAQYSHGAPLRGPAAPARPPVRPAAAAEAKPGITHEEGDTPKPEEAQRPAASPPPRPHEEQFGSPQRITPVARQPLRAAAYRGKGTGVIKATDPATGRPVTAPAVGNAAANPARRGSTDPDDHAGKALLVLAAAQESLRAAAVASAHARDVDAPAAAPATTAGLSPGFFDAARELPGSRLPSTVKSVLDVLGILAAAALPVPGDRSASAEERERARRMEEVMDEDDRANAACARFADWLRAVDGGHGHRAEQALAGLTPSRVPLDAVHAVEEALLHHAWHAVDLSGGFMGDDDEARWRHEDAARHFFGPDDENGALKARYLGLVEGESPDAAVLLRWVLSLAEVTKLTHAR